MNPPDLLSAEASKRESDAPRGSSIPQTLSIVIPALNEQESIATTAQRCLDARSRIQHEAGLGRIEVIIVDDGSTDETGQIADELASREEDVRVIHFAKNRGYGAALKEGFREAEGELVAFLDADGTCDPLYFAEMCRVQREQSADIVLGSRMGPGSEMPRIRRIGNRLFAVLLGVVSGRAISDTASGMRVLRREALKRLYPLPDGLQFTPAMSARAVLDGLTIQEIEMSYAERVGQSKLRAIRDGIRFTSAILSALLVFRPARVFHAAAFVSLATAILWAVYPIEYYVNHHALQEGMIFRLLFCSLLLTCTFVFLSASVLADDILRLVYRRPQRSFVSGALDYLFSRRALLTIALVAPLTGTALVRHGLIEWVQTRQTQMHWSRAMLAVLLLQIAVCAAVTAVLRSVIGLWLAETRKPRL
jgi:glycosyltransferase involved in cell wall biosynthesis